MTTRLGILLSGSGSTYENLAAHCASGRLAAEIGIVISSREAAPGVAKAQRHGHPVVVARDASAVTAALLAAEVEWVAMCGWMRFYDPPAALAQRVVNIHPSLLPCFGGQGMYGAHVHAAVIAAGCRISGCTVHLVAGAYDSGPILAQQAVPVAVGDSVAELQARVQAAERQLYPRALAALIAGGLRQIDGRWCLPELPAACPADA